MTQQFFQQKIIYLVCKFDGSKAEWYHETPAYVAKSILDMK